MRIVNKLPQIPLASGKANTKKTLIVCSGIKRKGNDGEGKLPAPIQKSTLERLFPTFTAAFKGKEEPSASQALEEAEIISPSVSGKSTEQNIISLCVDEKDQPLIEGFLRDLQVSNLNVYAALQSILKNNLSLVPELLKPEIREIISSLNINQALEDETEQTNALNKVKLNLLGINEESQTLVESFLENLKTNNPEIHLCLKLILERNPHFSRELLKAEIRENINELNIVSLGTETEQRNALVKVKNTLRGIKEENTEIINDEKSIDNFRKVIIPSLQFTREEQAAFGALDPDFQLELMEGYYALKKLEDSNKQFPLSSNQFLELGIEEAGSPFILNLKENTSDEEKFHIKLIKYFANNLEILSTKDQAKFIDAITRKLVDSREKFRELENIIGILARPAEFWLLRSKEYGEADGVLTKIRFLVNHYLFPLDSTLLYDRYSYQFPFLINKFFEDYLTLKPKEGRFESIVIRPGKSIVLDYSNLDDLQALTTILSQEIRNRTQNINYLIQLIEDSTNEFYKVFPAVAKTLKAVSLFDKLTISDTNSELEFINLKKIVDEMITTVKLNPEIDDWTRNQISLYEKSWTTDPPDFRRLVQHGSIIRPGIISLNTQRSALRFYQMLNKVIEREFDLKNSQTLEESLEKSLNSLNEKNQRLMKIAKDNGTFNSTTIPLNDEIGVADRFTAETEDILKGYQEFAMSGEATRQALEEIDNRIKCIPFRLKQLEELVVSPKDQEFKETIFKLFFDSNILKDDYDADWVGAEDTSKPTAEIIELLKSAAEEIKTSLSEVTTDSSVNTNNGIQIDLINCYLTIICDDNQSINSLFPSGRTLTQRKSLVDLIETFLDKAYLKLTNQDLNTPLYWEMGIENYKIEKELEKKETAKSLERAKEVISKNIQERQKVINLGKCSEQSKEIFEEDVKKLEQLLSELKPDSKAWENNRNTIIHEIETITGISFGNYLTNSEILQGIAFRESKMNELKKYAENANNLPPQRTDEFNSLMEQLKADQKFILLNLKPTEYLEFFKFFDNTFSRIKTLVPEFQDNEKAKDEIILTDLQSQAKALMRQAQFKVHPDYHPTKPDESRELNNAYSELETILTNPNSPIIDQYSKFIEFKRTVQEISGLNPDEIKKELPAEVNDQDNDSKNIEPEEDQDEDQSDGLGGLPVPDRNPQPNNNPQGDGGAAEAIAVPEAPANTQDTQFQQVEPTPINDRETLTNQSALSPEVNLSELASKYTNPAITAGDSTGSGTTLPESGKLVDNQYTGGTTVEPKTFQGGGESLSASTEALKSSKQPTIGVAEKTSDDPVTDNPLKPTCEVKLAEEPTQLWNELRRNRTVTTSATPPASVGLDAPNFEEPETIPGDSPVKVVDKRKVVEVPANQEENSQQLTSDKLPARQAESVPVLSN